MIHPLLTTKTHMPPARADLVPRPRLFRLLDHGLTLPLTLVSASPGSGKTSLVASWLNQCALPTAWYSVDEHDNDLTRFLTYLVSALETLQMGIGRQALEALNTPRRPSVEAVLTMLSNDIAAIPEDFVLVLDDYHHISLTAIHEALTFLLESPQPRMHLVLATRTDPPLPLARLRARNQLVELRIADLRFTVEEAAEFLNDRMGLNLTVDQVAAVDDRAEGWIAGLQLAALSMHGHEDVAGFLREFKGTHRFILDYLLEEVFHRQTSEIQTFLLQTSLLDQMDAALADAITGRNDSGQLLLQLEKANLFVIPLDDVRHWYRYHHLFADFLRSYLQQSQPEQVAELHRRASARYEQLGFIDEAVQHALAIPDFDRAAYLIERKGEELISRSEDALILTWLSRLPAIVMQQRSQLRVIRAAALAGTGNLKEAAGLLTRIDDVQLAPPMRLLAYHLRAGIEFLNAGLERAIGYARNTLKAVESSAASGTQAQYNSSDILAHAEILANYQLAAGQLHAAVSTCRYGLDLDGSNLQDSSGQVPRSLLYLILAQVNYEWNDLQLAVQYAELAADAGLAGHNSEFEAAALTLLAQVKEAQGDRAGASAALERAEQLVRGRSVAVEVRAFAARQVNVLVGQGRVDEATKVMRALPAEDPTTFSLEGVYVYRSHPSVSRARLLVAQREFAPAVQLLERLQEQASASAEAQAFIGVLALFALARDGQGEASQAMATLEQALSLGEPEGYVRTFVDLGEPMRSMISAYAQRSSARSYTEGNQPVQALTEYADRLLSSFAGNSIQSRAPEVMIQRTDPDVAEPLSDREHDVLQLIAEGLSNQQIAERLVVSVSTVKSHIYHIFAKLGVGSRTQAIARAHELKLL